MGTTDGELLAQRVEKLENQLNEVFRRFSSMEKEIARLLNATGLNSDKESRAIEDGMYLDYVNSLSRKDISW